MIKKRSRNIELFCLLGTCILISLISIQLTSNLKNNDIAEADNLNNKLATIPTVYEINSFSILIDNTNPDEAEGYHTWEWWKNNYAWCYVSSDVYYIKNVEVSGGYRIYILDSNVDFVIENCTVLDSNLYGIKLKNVQNGILINNNFSCNAQNGIHLLRNCYNNEIRNNSVCYNSENGIFLEEIRIIEWIIQPILCDYIYLPCNNNEILNNTVDFNTKNGIKVQGYDNDHKCINNNINGNMAGNNGLNGIYIDYGDDHTIEANLCFENLKDGIYIVNSDDHTIKNNLCFNNEYNGIFLLYSDINTIDNNTCTNNEHNGICLTSSDKNAVLNNEADGNSVSGISLSDCDRNRQWNNELSGNTISNNKYGIYLCSSDYNYIGTGNIATANTEYGIYLSDGSSHNNVIGNTVNNNALYDICYENDDCTGNAFEDNGVAAINLANPNAGTGGGLDMPFLSLIIFFGIIFGVGGSVGYIQMTKNKRSRERERVEKNIYDRPRLVLHNDEKQISSNLNHPHNHDINIIKPQHVAPYEFYCSKCDKKSVGYQVFCTTCGERMTQPDLIAKPETREKISCVICHSSTCSSCSHEMSGEEACYEECPYCGRLYHKHCWDKTIKLFGKCGFCLETPPPELMPRSIDTNNHFAYDYS